MASLRGSVRLIRHCMHGATAGLDHRAAANISAPWISTYGTAAPGNPLKSAPAPPAPYAGSVNQTPAPREPGHVIAAKRLCASTRPTVPGFGPARLASSAQSLQPSWPVLRDTGLDRHQWGAEAAVKSSVRSAPGATQDGCPSSLTSSTEGQLPDGPIAVQRDVPAADSYFKFAASRSKGKTLAS